MKTKSNNVLLGSGVLTAVTASLCCITPVLAFIAGGSGIASAFSWMEPLRPYLIGITALVLGFAWYQKLKPRTAEEIACACEPARYSGGEDDLPAGKAGKKPFMQSKIFLGIVTVFAALMLAFPYYSSAFYPDNKQEALIVNASDMQVLHLDVQGMTCEACDSHVEHVAQEVTGVIEAKANHATGKAEIQFDRTRTTEHAIIQTIDETSYKVVDSHKE